MLKMVAKLQQHENGEGTTSVHDLVAKQQSSKSAKEFGLNIAKPHLLLMTLFLKNM